MVKKERNSRIEWEWARVVEIILLNSWERQEARLSPLQCSSTIIALEAKVDRKYLCGATWVKFCHLIFIHVVFFLLPLTSVSSFSPTSARICLLSFCPIMTSPHLLVFLIRDQHLQWRLHNPLISFFSSVASDAPPLAISRFFSLFPTNTWPTSPSPAIFLICDQHLHNPLISFFLVYC